MGTTWLVPGGKEERKAKSGTDMQKGVEQLGGAHHSERLHENMEMPQSQELLLLPCVGGYGFRV